ncbi:MAG: ATP-dependent 6-phosphofructokinase [Acidobacteriota bacterium]|nr:MAG: ATP-dependent 6-phosphofructokinase [Acidobacteriota bacterium]
MGKRIGILTGGGDVPGLNPCIRSIVVRAVEDGDEVIGIRRGWSGLLNFNLDDDEASRQKHTIELTKDVVRTIARTGGTFLHTSRTNPSNVDKDAVPLFLRSSAAAQAGREYVDFTGHVLKVLDFLKVDALIPIGGDDTLSYAHRMHTEGVKVVAVPKTMDNDVHGTDYCIGFSTAVSRSVEYITQLRTSTGSHERIGIIELFGRNSGETSLMAAYLAGVDRAIISEVPFDPDRLAQFLVEDQEKSPSNYAVMTISEGARMIGGEILESGPADAYGHRKLGGIGEVTAAEIRKRTGRNLIYQQLGYLMRSGAPDSLDRMVSANYGSLAIDLIQNGLTGRLVVLKEGRYGHEDIDIVAQGVKRVDVDTFYDIERYLPKVTNVLGKPMFLY